jgi:hypothetical protein
MCRLEHSASARLTITSPPSTSVRSMSKAPSLPLGERQVVRLLPTASGRRTRLTERSRPRPRRARGRRRTRQRADLLGERLVDDVHELVDRTAAKQVAADAGELPRGAGVRRLKHVLDRAAHQNLTVERLEASEPEVLRFSLLQRCASSRDASACPASRSTRIVTTSPSPPSSASYEQKPRSEADLLREPALDAAHEVVHRSRTRWRHRR